MTESQASPATTHGASAAAAAMHGLAPRDVIGGVAMTYDEYRSLPEGRGYDLLDGLCFREPMPTLHHQLIADNVVEILRNFARRTRAGIAVQSIDIHLDPRNCPAPDVCFISTERRSHLDERGLHGVAPDLCVEVASPSTARRDRTQKAVLYGRYGCREYWLVDGARRTVEIWRVAHDGGLAPAGAHGPGEAFDSTVLPGLRVEVDAVFAEM
jgi:Uma2 family endonuclease